MATRQTLFTGRRVSTEEILVSPSNGHILKAGMNYWFIAAIAPALFAQIAILC